MSIRLHWIEGDAGFDLTRIDGDDADLVAVVPPGTVRPADDAVVSAYEALDARVVVAASPVSAHAPGIVDAPSPYRAVAPALLGPAAALRALDRLDVDALGRAYVAGADLELDVHAEVFLTRDGTNTDAVHIGDMLVATATGTHPPIVLGGDSDVARSDPRDLARLFAYEEAVDFADHAHVVAPEILQVPFWTPAMCAAVVRAAEAANAWSDDPDDPVPGREVSLATLSPRLASHVEAHVEHVVVPCWRAVWPEFRWAGIHDAFVIKYAAGAATAELPLHHDVAQISASVRLNAGYEGGALEFPRQQWSNAVVPVGAMVAWPSLVTHPHRSAPVERGVKYGLTVWLAIDG